MYLITSRHLGLTRIGRPVWGCLSGRAIRHQLIFRILYRLILTSMELQTASTRLCPSTLRITPRPEVMFLLVRTTDLKLHVFCLE